MRRAILSLLLLASLWGSGFAFGMASGWAQTGPIGPPPDPQFVQNALAVLQQQRNRAQDEAAQAQAQLALVQSKLETATKELEQLKAAPKPAEPAKK